MDNAAYIEDEKNKKNSSPSNVELQEVQVSKNIIQTINPDIINKEQCCKADLCKKMHLEYIDRQRRESQNPTDRIKYLFFIGTLGLFFIWLILYTTMSQFDLV